MQVRVVDQISVALASDRRRALAPKRGEVRRGKQEICANYVDANTPTHFTRTIPTIATILVTHKERGGQ